MTLQLEPRNWKHFFLLAAALLGILLGLSLLAPLPAQNSGDRPHPVSD